MPIIEGPRRRDPAPNDNQTARRRHEFRPSRDAQMGQANYMISKPGGDGGASRRFPPLQVDSGSDRRVRGVVPKSRTRAAPPLPAVRAQTYDESGTANFKETASPETSDPNLLPSLAIDIALLSAVSPRRRLPFPAAALGDIDPVTPQRGKAIDRPSPRTSRNSTSNFLDNLVRFGTA